MVPEALSWLSSAAFWFLGAYVGAVSALVVGGASLAWTVASGAARVPFVFFEELRSIYAEEAPLGQGGAAREGAMAPPAPRRTSRLAEPPEVAAVAGAPAGAAASGYGYGDYERGLPG